MKIIGGLNKRTIIQVPKYNVRPTSAQKRESIFSIIESYGIKNEYNIYNQANILDLFAGTGSLGLEAISRGAVFGYFYENNSKIILNLKKNCLKICKNNKFKIINEDILTSKFKNINKKISIVFIDPPYNIKLFEKIFININQSKILSKNAIIIIECYKKTKINIPHYYNCFNERIYGKTKIFFLVYQKNQIK